MTTNEKIVEIIAEQLSVDKSKVIGAANLADDLGADSLDLVELIMAFEEAFDCEISDEQAEKITTVQACFDYADEHKLIIA